MREIKFRAWHKEKNKMYQVGSYSNVHQCVNCCELTDNPPYFRWTFTFDEIELMQFTGSYDKYGTEIYEGDVVNLNGKEYVVKYFNKYSRFALSSNDEVDRLPMLITNLSNVEVIGNVYENIFWR